jgi:hypothetical protein
MSKLVRIGPISVQERLARSKEKLGMHLYAHELRGCHEKSANVIGRLARSSHNDQTVKLKMSIHTKCSQMQVDLYVRPKCCNCTLHEHAAELLQLYAVTSTCATGTRRNAYTMHCTCPSRRRAETTPHESVTIIPMFYHVQGRMGVSKRVKQ